LAAINNANKGTTDGNATTCQKKRKPGHPPREANLEEDNWPSTHFYLVNEDGTPVLEDNIAEMSCKARMIWTSLDNKGLALESFSQISLKAWELLLTYDARARGI